MAIEKRKFNNREVDWDTELGGPVITIPTQKVAPSESAAANVTDENVTAEDDADSTGEEAQNAPQAVDPFAVANSPAANPATDTTSTGETVEPTTENAPTEPSEGPSA